MTQEHLPLDDEGWSEAFDARRQLARTGRHRAVGIHDLLTAVLAARHRVTVVHHDADLVLAGVVLSFEQRWVAPPGSL